MTEITGAGEPINWGNESLADSLRLEISNIASGTLGISPDVISFITGVPATVPVLDLGTRRPYIGGGKGGMPMLNAEATIARLVDPVPNQDGTAASPIVVAVLNAFSKHDHTPTSVGLPISEAGRDFGRGYSTGGKPETYDSLVVVVRGDNTTLLGEAQGQEGWRTIATDNPGIPEDKRPPVDPSVSTFMGGVIAHAVMRASQESRSVTVEPTIEEVARIIRLPHSLDDLA